MDSNLTVSAANAPEQKALENAGAAAVGTVGQTQNGAWSVANKR